MKWTRSSDWTTPTTTSTSKMWMGMPPANLGMGLTAGQPTHPITPLLISWTSQPSLSRTTSKTSQSRLRTATTALTSKEYPKATAAATMQAPIKWAAATFGTPSLRTRCNRARNATTRTTMTLARNWEKIFLFLRRKSKTESTFYSNTHKTMAQKTKSTWITKTKAASPGIIYLLIILSIWSSSSSCSWNRICRRTRLSRAPSQF